MMMRAHVGVDGALERLEQHERVGGGRAPNQPVVVPVLGQLVHLRQRQPRARAPQVRRDVETLQRRPHHQASGQSASSLCRLVISVSDKHLAKPCTCCLARG